MNCTEPRRRSDVGSLPTRYSKALKGLPRQLVFPNAVARRQRPTTFANQVGVLFGEIVQIDANLFPYVGGLNLGGVEMVRGSDVSSMPTHR